mmetsp:Transcript_40721/g.94357  ORF Transcript_40721/g.94357 Transcript_40721/m.94357 type:complete len:580 (+) Transcript_40721:30-1769(+)
MEVSPGAADEPADGSADAGTERASRRAQLRAQSLASEQSKRADKRERVDSGLPATPNPGQPPSGKRGRHAGSATPGAIGYERANGEEEEEDEEDDDDKDVEEAPLTVGRTREQSNPSEPRKVAVKLKSGATGKRKGKKVPVPEGAPGEGGAAASGVDEKAGTQVGSQHGDGAAKPARTTAVERAAADAAEVQCLARSRSAQQLQPPPAGEPDQPPSPAAVAETRVGAREHPSTPSIEPPPPVLLPSHRARNPPKQHPEDDAPIRRRPKSPAPAKEGTPAKDAEDAFSKVPGDSTRRTPGDTSGYKCSRCGQPKKGHVCTPAPAYDPRAPGYDPARHPAPNADPNSAPKPAPESVREPAPGPDPAHREMLPSERSPAPPAAKPKPATNKPAGVDGGERAQSAPKEKPGGGGGGGGERAQPVAKEKSVAKEKPVTKERPVAKEKTVAKEKAFAKEKPGVGGGGSGGGGGGGGERAQSAPKEKPGGGGVAKDAAKKERKVGSVGAVKGTVGALLPVATVFKPPAAKKAEPKQQNVAPVAKTKKHGGGGGSGGRAGGSGSGGGSDGGRSSRCCACEKRCQFSE